LFFLLWWKYIVAFTNISTHEFTSSTILLHSPSPHSWSSLTDIIFAFISMCTQFLHHIHPPTTFPHASPSNWTILPPGQGLFWNPVLFVEKITKNMTF
jgi:hypothetical protein